MNSFSKSTQIISFCLLSIHLHFLLFLMISITQFPLASHGCQEHERSALLDFKLSLSDPSNRLLSWQEGIQHQNCCHWHGIECSHDSVHVVSIDLRNRYFQGDGRRTNTALHGKLSPSIFNISHLGYLDLSFNDFQGSQIPLQFSTHLSKLTHLDLAGSNFSGSISTQFSNLTSLSYLDLSRTRYIFDYPISCFELTSTKWVRGLENLKTVYLSGTDLSKVTSSPNNFAEDISYLSNLEYLDISSCSISTTIFPIHGFHNLSRLSTLRMNLNQELSSEIPIEVANLTSLSILDLNDCGLQGSVPYLPQLTELDVSGNSDLRPDLARMFQRQWPKLQTLSISKTNVSGSIPVSISNAPLLVSLDASSCSIQGSLPSSISNLSRLESLILSGNNMTGSIPISVCQMSSLRELDLNDNKLTGTIPSCLTDLKNLTFFSVSGNSIGGSVSLINFINGLNLIMLDLSSNRLTVVIDQRFHLYSKFKLQYLDLRSCNLKGVFPTFICKFSHLQDLDLSQNHLEGVIPSHCFSKLLAPDSFNLSNNNFHGPLPLPPQTINSGLSFDVSNNKLSGEISTECGERLSNFYSINLAGNELSGSIPFSTFSNNSVNYINLSNNNFSASIPYSICSRDSQFSPLYIDFSNNNLSGVIPASIGYCMDLKSLNLGTNNLTGNVPNGLEQLSLEYLQLNDNNLDGTPLNVISKSRNLAVLNLANNNFGGSIPSTFGSLQNLKLLSLRLNNFNGSIPEEIIQLEYLQMLDLSENNLTGAIPRKIGNLMMLRSRPKDVFSLVETSLIDVRLQMVIKGIMIQFEKLYDYSSGIDLSCNSLEGNIPDEIGLLKGLSTLNLSHNHLSGVIPKSVGNMSGLESLDLSFNRLSGNIPLSLASVSSLAYLNLSYNNLSGTIPREPHFDTLSGDGAAYAHNSLLCGTYTNHTCEGDQRSNATDGNFPNEGYEDDSEDGKEKLLLYAIVALGFAVGFWGLFLVLLLKKQKWWFGYWRLVDVVAVRVVNCLLQD